MVPKYGNIITYSSESRTHRHVRTNKKATLQSRDYPAIETPASKSGVWSHDLKVENTITYGSESRAHKHVRTNKKATLQSRDYPAIETPAAKSNIQSNVLYNEFIGTYYF